MLLSMKSCLSLSSLLLVSLLSGGQPLATATKAKQARNVTGHYVMRREEFRNRLDVEQLANGKIKFDLIALWVSANNPDNIHNGEIQATVSLEKGVAVYEAGDCRLKMEFQPTSVRIWQSDEAGDCGFGANVTATGTYRKSDSKKPKFDF
jgi:hypothetical protein